MGEIYIRGIDLPPTINGVTVLDADGNYNIYINTALGYNAQRKAACHELAHIRKDHFYDFLRNSYNFFVLFQSGIDKFLRACYSMFNHKTLK